MDLQAFLKKLNDAPNSIDFTDTIAVIDAMYDFTPSTFQNGEQLNAAGQNNGSCKLFSFAKLNNLNEQQTLHCFGNYYRDVLNTPAGADHANIRNFMKYGWDGIEFDGTPLKPKA
ncbi:MAG TPA: HopJ type III effector protein [Gallionellaceae bacterium]|nr:HopJ type III effector protein [Gallionellaceae bacterium]